MLLSGVLLWNVAYATGTIDNAEWFMESFGWQTFEFHGGEVFHDVWIIGMFAAAGLVGLAVLAAATFNLVSDLGRRRACHRPRGGDGRAPGDPPPQAAHPQSPTPCGDGCSAGSRANRRHRRARSGPGGSQTLSGRGVADLLSALACLPALTTW